MIRLGLCCIFRAEPIRFRRKTAAWLSLEEDLTVEVEAKAKELAVNRLRKDLTDQVVLFPDIP